MAAIVRTALRDDWERGLRARVAAVISNRADAPGLEIARGHGIATSVLEHRSFATREDFDAALAQEIDRHDPHRHPALVVLAGFMRVLSPRFVRHFDRRLVNIHPSLLPAFPGLQTHARVLAAGCRFSGATVHLVTEQLDEGPILAQAALPVLESDTPQSLAARVLTQEHLLYPRAIARYLQS